MFTAQQEASSALPLIASKMNSQVNFFLQVSQKMIEGTQELSTLNLQVAKTMLDEAAASTQHLLSAKNYNEAVSVTSDQTRPTIEKVRAYQQHVQRILSETQADIAKTIEAYIPEATRTTQEVVQTLTKRAADQTSQIMQRQQDAVGQLATAAKQSVNQTSEHIAGSAEQMKEATERLAAATKQGANRMAEGNTKEIITK